MSDRKKLEVLTIKEGDGPEMWDIFTSFQPLFEGLTPILHRTRPVGFLVSRDGKQTELDVFITGIKVEIKANEDSDSSFFIIEGFTSAEYEKRDCVDRAVRIKYWPHDKKGEGESWKLEREITLNWY